MLSASVPAFPPSGILSTPLTGGLVAGSAGTLGGGLPVSPTRSRPVSPTGGAAGEAAAFASLASGGTAAEIALADQVRNAPSPEKGGAEEGEGAQGPHRSKLTDRAPFQPDGAGK